jgi:hypothetical protein
MIADKNRVFDGWLTLEGGVDAGRAPDTIAINQVQSAKNMSFRGGIPTTRPGFRDFDESFQDITKQLWCFSENHTYPDGKSFIGGEYKPSNISTDTITTGQPDPWFAGQNSEDIYKKGILQCAHGYSPHNGEDCIMALVSGRLFRITPKVTTAEVVEIMIEDQPRNLCNMKRLPIAYMVQADKWLIAQDGMSAPIIYDGSKARRSKTSGLSDETEVPVGTIMAYGMGRLVVIVNNRDVAFGDLYGSHDLPDPADSLILFTERNFLAEGFDAAIPFTQGKATGMMFFPQLDTSTGNGQLMVLAERGATNFFLSLDRSLWKTSSFQILSLLTTGLRGHRSISVVNEDLWFRSDDGMRSYRQARSEPAGWAHIPLSTNVKQYLGSDSEFLLKYCSSMYFDNRILVTTAPIWNNGRPAHWGMAVVDFDIIGAFGGTASEPQTSRPAWEGLWTLSSFMFPIQIFTGTFKGVTRAFLYVVNNQAENQIFELSLDDKDDWDGQKINWEFVSRAFDFNKLSPGDSTVFTENELYDGDLWLKEIIE